MRQDAQEESATQDGRTLHSLPAELLQMIFTLVSYRVTFCDCFELIWCIQLPQRDTSSLIRTCKRFHTLGLPQLYETLTLRLPVCWSSLSSLENLVGSTSIGLRSTIIIRITTSQQWKPDALQHSSNSNPVGLFCLPDQTSESSFNVLLRLLIMKIPKSQGRALQSVKNSPFGGFFSGDLLIKVSRIRHNVALDAVTASYLFMHQGATLVDLYLTRFLPMPAMSPSGLNAHGPVGGKLSTLHINSLHPSSNSDWPAMLISKNHASLQHLELGMETEAAAACSMNNLQLIPGGMGPCFKTSMLKTLGKAPSHLEWPTLSLDSLIVSGLDFGCLIKSDMGFIILFNKLRLLSK